MLCTALFWCPDSRNMHCSGIFCFGGWDDLQLVERRHHRYANFISRTPNELEPKRVLYDLGDSIRLEQL